MNKLLDIHKIFIQKTCKNLGFLEASFISLCEDPNYTAYTKWIKKGFHGHLEYMENNSEKRKNPSSLSNNLKSGIVFLHPYPKEFQSKWIAKYAWGKDYHKIIKDKINEISRLFQNQFEYLADEKVCVDTVPLLERSLAQRSGLGWIGKNACLISRKNGSFFFIASWLISLDTIEKDNKHSFHCGTCTRCIDACPTQAIVGEGVIDANKCISTHTIEYRKSLIPPSIHQHLNPNAFGCDICQDVCPWNRKYDINVEDEHLPELEMLLTIEENEFRSFFRKTSTERASWAGLRRNFLIAYSQEDNFKLDIIQKHLEHPNSLIQETAQQILKLRL